MYSFTLFVHSWIRWVVLALALLAALRGIQGRVGGRPWTPASARANLLATISLDIQMLLGLALYAFLSPFTREAFGDFGAAMRTPALRYWAVEHVAVMVVALILAHVGNVLARKARSDSARHLRSAVFFGLVFLLLVVGTPWAGMSNGRPLFRLGKGILPARSFAHLHQDMRDAGGRTATAAAQRAECSGLRAVVGR
jgi:hypothetical protein